MVATVTKLAVCALIMTILPFYPAVANPSQVDDIRADVDQDGLNAAQENLYATDPNDPDSDGDEIYDGWEVWYENHRSVGPGSAVEIVAKAYHFDPNYEPDAGKVVYKFNLIMVRDADANIAVNDPDDDGWNNLHEFLVGSDPTNPNTDGDCFKVDSSDQDPLVSNGACVDPPPHDDHGGNGGGGSGEGRLMAETMA